MRSPGGWKLSLSPYPGVGNRPPRENKIANPRGYARGGKVTGRIEPCINLDSENSVSQMEHLYFAQTGLTIIINPLNPTHFKIFFMKEACSNICVSFDCGFS